MRTSALYGQKRDNPHPALIQTHAGCGDYPQNTDDFPAMDEFRRGPEKCVFLLKECFSGRLIESFALQSR